MSQRPKKHAAAKHPATAPGRPAENDAPPLPAHRGVTRHPWLLGLCTLLYAAWCLFLVWLLFASAKN